MQMVLSTVLVFVGLMVVAGVFQAYRAHQRQRGSQLASGESEVRLADGVSVRLYVDRSILGGPRAPGGRDRARVVLSNRRLLLATGHGRVVEIAHDRPGSVRCVGPRRLVIEGDHPTGRARVRAELVVDDAEGWQADAQRLVAARISA